MTYFDRFLLLLYTLGTMIVLFVIGLAVAGWTTPIYLFQVSLSRYDHRIIIGIITVVFLILSIKFFLQSLTRERRLPQAVVHETGIGQVRVSNEAVENMVSRIVNQVRGVREVSPRVIFLPEGINIFIRVVLLPEINIPQTSDEIQNRVTDYMSEVAGIKIKSVKILVENISGETKPGTPRKLM